MTHLTFIKQRPLLISLVLFLLVFPIPLSAQLFPKTAYPSGYLRNPLAIPIVLSGNFGEIRSGHFHMGLDIKTRGAVNQPVYAAADGYIARIKIEPFGFGRAIYISHPNGYTTVYAHLNDFNQSLEHWVKEQQYQKESWSVSLDLPPSLFPVKKGDFLAYSGTTGGSQAPHLHFEVRRTADEMNLNPQLFGMPLPDNTRPQIARFAIYDGSKTIYDQSPRLIRVKAAAPGLYKTTQPVIELSSPSVGFAVGAWDTHNGGTNHIGIYESTLFLDDSAVTGFRMNNISYNETRYINAHIDYKTKVRTGANLQLLWRQPGYINSIYSSRPGSDGIIMFKDTQTHTIKVVVKDAGGDESVLTTKVRYNGRATVSGAGMAGKLFLPLMVDGYEGDECEFFIGENCLYAPAHIGYSKSAGASNAVSSVHTIGVNYIPLQEPFLIRIKPTRSLTDIERSRTLMQWYSGNTSEVQKVEWNQNYAAARFRDFGNFQLVIDTIPPVIVPVGFSDGADLQKSKRLVFTIKDNYDEFRNVRTELDGKWIRFTNDKGRTFIYAFDEKCLPGEHTLKISADDEAGNSTTGIYKFTR